MKILLPAICLSGVLLAFTSPCGFAQADTNAGVVEKTVHTTKIAPLRGEGKVSLSQQDDKVHVTITDLSLACDIHRDNWQLTGLRIGLLSPERRENRTGSDMSERIRQRVKLLGSQKYEPDAFSASFRAQQGAALEDYEVCLWILNVMNGGQEGMVFAHTGDPAIKNEFSRLRKVVSTRRPDGGASSNPKVAGLRDEMAVSLEAELAGERKLRSEYAEALSKAESNAFEDGFLQVVLAVRSEKTALLSSRSTDLSEFADLNNLQKSFLRDARSAVESSLPGIVKVLQMQLTKIEEKQTEVEKADATADKAALDAEKQRIQELLDSPDQLASKLKLPWMDGDENSKPD